MVPILKTVYLEDLELCLIDSQIPKMAGLAGLESLLNLLLQKAEGLADSFYLRSSRSEANLLVLLW